MDAGLELFAHYRRVLQIAIQNSTEGWYETMTERVCDVQIDATSAWLLHPAFAVRLNLSGELQIVEWVNRLSGHSLVGRGSELTCSLDAALQRIDLLGWRQKASSESLVLPDEDEGYQGRYFAPFHDDASWCTVVNTGAGYTNLIPTLYPPLHETDIHANRYQWARSHFLLPETASGQPVSLTLGGYSLGDFDYMRVFLNGESIGVREVTGLFREPGVFTLDPGSEAYARLRFGQDNVVALQLKDYFSRPPDLEQRDPSRAFSMHTAVWNVFFEQYVVVGVPLTYERFHVESHQVLLTGERAEFLVKLRSSGGIVAQVHYTWSSENPVLSRATTLDNPTGVRWPLLDIDFCQFGGFGTEQESGGVGFPAYVDEQFFVSSTHPASLNQHNQDGLRVRHFYGRDLAPGQQLALPEVVLGVSASGDNRRAYRECVTQRARRVSRDHQRAYHLFVPMNDDETFYKYASREISRLDACARLQQQEIIHFDAFILGYFHIDAGGDFLHFDAQRWPDGADEFFRRLTESGMKLGLGLAGTSPTCWSLGNNPVLADSYNTVYATHAFCMAAPGYRALVSSGMRNYVRQFGMEFFLIDQTFHRCHNPHHGHRIGNYSITASVEACIDLFQMLDQENPNLFMQLYWGFASPWWLQWADTLFESKGMLMEARNPTELPTLFFRDSVTLGLDRAHEYSAEVPRCGKDSLGIWLTKNLWNSDIGTERWAEGLVMDLCRGSLLAQLWGHPDMLSTQDWRDAARLIGLLREHPQCFAHSRLVLGDPWTDPLYGYCCAHGDRAFIALNNCSWTEQVAELELNERWGLPDAGPWAISRWWPHPSQLTTAQGEAQFTAVLRYPLRPFEIVLLEVVRSGGSSAGDTPMPEMPLPCPAAEPSRSIPLHIEQLEIAASAPADQAYHSLVQDDGDYALAWSSTEPLVSRQTVRLTATLPPTTQSATLAVIVRMYTGNYAARIMGLLDAAQLHSATALLDGDDLCLTPVVGRADVCWQVYQTELEASATLRALEVTIASAVDPLRVRLEFECILLPGIVKPDVPIFHE